ncbi:MAG: hypothetical protein KatS3mg102_0817 [Planctomycetota bacterium]|nr:MAG: hypothetical protein KatS3mg102_0817 [Planctomycetota bacterium]
MRAMQPAEPQPRRPARGAGSPEAPPPTVIVRHRRERVSKCSLEPLRGRPDLVFVTYPDEQPPALAGYVRLALHGPPLSRADAGCGLLLLDASWRLVRPMERRYREVPARSLPPLATAYPRSSKLAPDPPGGLASVEALFAAYWILGRPTAGLLEHYRWREPFLAHNRALLQQLRADRSGGSPER